MIFGSILRQQTFYEQFLGHHHLTKKLKTQAISTGKLRKNFQMQMMFVKMGGVVKVEIYEVNMKIVLYVDTF